MTITASHGTLLQRATQVTAHSHSGVVGNNNAILWTAVTEGDAGELVNYHIVDPGGTAALSVVVAGVAIHVNLQTNTGTIISTAAQVITAVRASDAASALVTVTDDGASTGAGTMVAQVETFLADGADTVTYNTIAQVKDISGPNFSRGTIDTTNHDSASGWKTYVVGMKENGEVTAALNFLPTDVTQDEIYGLIKDYKHGTLRAFKMIFPNTAATEWTFNAYVTALTFTTPVEGVLGANLTLKLSGVPTLA